MSANIMKDLQEALGSGQTFVMCTVIEVMGSSPGQPGQKMFVYNDGSTTGTVGGGVNEERVRKEAMPLFFEGKTKLISFTMNKDASSDEPICGGTMKVFLEAVQDQPRMVIFGGGHIGLALTKLAKTAGFRITLVDERPEYTEACRVPEAETLLCCSYEDSVAKVAVDAATFVVIVTPGHAKDREVLERVIKTPALYVGMIGSARKVEELKKRLIAEGADAQKLQDLFSPIGLNLGGESPEEIAVAILAQIIAFRHGKILRFERDKK